MEYVDGGDLWDAVLARRAGPADAASILLQIGNALTYAHASKIVHRDVKPGNILVSRDGLKLTDFDLVQAADTTGGTRTGTGMGTMGFMAPELAKDAKRIDPRVDVFSLGMIGQFILYGADLPYDATYAAPAFREMLAWPAGLRPIVERASAMNPDDRYPSVAEMCEDLRQLLENRTHEDPVNRAPC